MLEVREQARLSFRRLLAICVDSISYRLLRSVVTVFIIIVAIAFLAAIIEEGYLGRAARDAVRVRTKVFTAYSRFLRRVNRAPPPKRLALEAAALEEGTADFDNLCRWGGFADEQARAFIRDSRQVRAYRLFFDDIPVGRRVLLVQQSTGLATFDWLQDAANFDAFDRALEPMKSLKVPGTFEAFKAFLENWPAYRKRLGVVRDGYAKAVRSVADRCAPDDVPAAFARAVADGKAEAFLQAVGERGFRVAEADVPAILAGQAYHARIEWAYGFLKYPSVRRGWNRQFHETFGPGGALASCADRPERIDWIAQQVRQEDGDAAFDRARFAQVAEEYLTRRRLLDAEQSLMGRYGESDELGERTIWLICVSFLVCAVGIANAMLMSVLERFKEIATMKCLGARNGAIAFLFIAESVILGVVGGTIGMLAGFGVALVRQVWSHGTLVFDRFPTTDTLYAFITCFACSLLLTAVASMYPARVAARMAPMEAMRVD